MSRKPQHRRPERNQPSAMDLRRLRYFLHVAEMKSLSKAAAVLSVAQSALSRQMIELEKAIGTKLLYRDGRGVSLTEAGDRLLPHARSILRQVELAHDEVRTLNHAPSGKIRLGIPPSTTELLVVPLIRRLRATLPDVSLTIVEGFSGYVHEWLLTARIDVAILYNAPQSHSTVIEPLLTEDLYLVEPWAPGRNPLETITFEQALELPLIMPGRPHGLRVLVDGAASRLGKIPNVVLELDALSAIKELVHLGMGYAIQPVVAVVRDLERDLVSARRIVDPELTRSLVLVTPTERALTVAAGCVATLVRSEIEALVRSGRWISHREPGV